MLFQPPDPRLLKGGESLFVRFWGTRGSIAVPGERTAKYGGKTAGGGVRTEEGPVNRLGCGEGGPEVGHHPPQAAPQPLRGPPFIRPNPWGHIPAVSFFGPG